MIAALLDPIRRQVREEPRLVRSSGEKDFDQAALAAMRIGLELWLSAQGFDSLIRAHGVPDAMGLSEKTVKNYLSNIFQKMQVSRRSQAAVLFERQRVGR